MLGQILLERGGEDLEILSNAAKRHQLCIQEDVSSGTKPWRDAALAMGFKSAMAAPMIWERNVFGSINAYADNPRAFDEEEANLLGELAEDLAFALHTIVEENERRQAENDLYESEQEKAAILRGLNVAVEYLDPQMRIIWLNNAVQDHLGLSEIETRGFHCYQVIQGARSPCPGVLPSRPFRQVSPRRGRWSLLTAKRGYPAAAPSKVQTETQSALCRWH